MADYSENYYLREFRDLQELDSFRQHQWFGKRQDLVETYSWAVPNAEAIEYIADLSPIVEIGAGKGYWSWLLRDAGANVYAYDISPPSQTWTTVEQGTEESILRSEDGATLLLCWPPYGEPMAYNALTKHIKTNGGDVIYVGEGTGGCTGDADFHTLLDERYSLRETIDIPSYEGIHDNMYHYCQKV